MPNNFRIAPGAGGIYFSKAGNDANSGLTPDLPKATPAEIGAATTYVLGAGEYEGAFSLHTVNGAAFTFDADGIVEFSCTADFVLVFNAITNFNTQQKGLLIINLNNTHKLKYGLVVVYANFKKSIVQDGTFEAGAAASRTNFENCVIKSMVCTNSLSDFAIKKTQVFSSTLSTGQYSSADSYVIDSFFDESSILSMPSYFATPSTQFKNNNFRGQIIVAGTPYELKKNKAGGAINPNPGVADLATIDATVYARGNFSQDPLHLLISKSDFWAVATNSPNIFADGSGVGNIGAVFGAVNVAATDAPFASPVSSSGLTASAGDIVWNASPGNPGTLLSQPIQVATVEGRPMKKGVISGLLNFNSSEVIGTAKNTSVVAVQNYAGGTAGANPRRVRTIEWRAKTTLAGGAPVNASDYDNQTYIPAGDFFASELLGLDTDFLIDVNGKGTEDPAFIAGSAAYVAAVWVQFRLTIQEGIG